MRSGGSPMHCARFCLQHKGALRGAGQDEPVGLAVVARQRAARLHRRHDDALVDQTDPRDMRGAGESRRRPGALGRRPEPVPVERDIARRLGPELRRLRQRRGRDIGDRIARLVIDRDKLGGVARDRLALGDDQRDGLADMADAVAGQRRTMRHDQPGAVRDRAGERHIADAGLLPCRRRSAPRGLRAALAPRSRRCRVSRQRHAASGRTRHAPRRLRARRRRNARRRSAGGGPRRAARTAGSSRDFLRVGSGRVRSACHRGLRTGPGAKAGAPRTGPASRARRSRATL